MTFKETLKTNKGVRLLIESVATSSGIPKSTLVDLCGVCYDLAVFEERLAAIERHTQESNSRDESTQSS